MRERQRGQREGGERDREGERERETQRERHRERETHRERKRDTEREGEREREREREREKRTGARDFHLCFFWGYGMFNSSTAARDRSTDRYIDKKINTHMHVYIEREREITST